MYFFRYTNLSCCSYKFKFRDFQRKMFIAISRFTACIFLFSFSCIVEIARLLKWIPKSLIMNGSWSQSWCFFHQDLSKGILLDPPWHLNFKLNPLTLSRGGSEVDFFFNENVLTSQNVGDHVLVCSYIFIRNGNEFRNVSHKL